MPLPTISLPTPNITPVCPYFGICGGCDMQDVSYDQQVLFKEERLKHLFSSLIKPSTLWQPFLSSDQTYPIYFRNKIRFSFIEYEGKIWPSRHKRGERNADIPVSNCFLQSPETVDIVLFISEFATEHKWQIFDSQTETGWLKHVLVRHGKRTKEILISLVTTDIQIPDISSLIQLLTDTYPVIKSVYQSVTEGKNNETITDRHVWGKTVIHEKIGDYTFQISPHAFFQTNSDMVETLYNSVASEINGGIVWDLYAGSATIGTYVSNRADRIIAIESNADNIRDAQWNIAHNQIHNLEVYEGLVEKVCTSSFINEQGTPETIIVDPPRAGLSEHIRTILSGIKPKKLVYISCNPLTCYRDCCDLVKRGFTITSIRGVDMFPHTIHCEMILVLER